MYLPKSSCMYHMTFRERTKPLFEHKKGNNHCEISQLNQFSESDLEGQKIFFFCFSCSNIG